MFLRILTLIKSISHIFRYMIINFFFCHDECPTFCDDLGTMRRGFFLEIAANKIFFTKPIMQSLSFVVIVNKVQMDPKMSMLTCQTTDRPHCVWKLRLYVTSQSEYLNKARWNVNHSYGIFFALVGWLKHLFKKLLHTVLHELPKVLRRRICLTIHSFFIWWSFPQFLWY